MAATDRARKLLVRTAFVTSTTIATLVGAQNLAMLDAKQFLPIETDPAQNTTTLLTTDTALPPSVTPTVPDAAIVQAAPSITILRQSGQAVLAQPKLPAVTNTNTMTVIQPPSAQMAAPQAVEVQQAAPQRTRSSR